MNRRSARDVSPIRNRRQPNLQKTTILEPTIQNTMNNCIINPITNRSFSKSNSKSSSKSSSNKKTYIKKSRDYSPGRKNIIPIIQEKKCGQKCLEHILDIYNYIKKTKPKPKPKPEKVKCLICLNNIKYNSKNIFTCSKIHNNIKCGTKLHKKCIKESCHVLDEKINDNMFIFYCPQCKHKYYMY
jgi:hypothetical protein